MAVTKPINLIGKKIRELREERGLSQSDLAARCGASGWDISRGTLSKIEAQVRRVTDSDLVSLANALRVPLEELYPKNVKIRVRKVT
ncbi:MAG: helix-turn-helix transcriptional regulator [Chthoniobacteraceae bacterium]